MAGFNINDMKSNLRLGGARPTLFQVELNFPTSVGNQQEATKMAPFMIQATSLPASTIRAIEVPYFGRKIKIAGDRSFGAWTVSVINDENFIIRQALEDWHNKINALTDNINTTGSSAPDLYKRDTDVHQYNKVGDRIRSYKFIGLFPTEISPIDVAWDKTDEIETFNVTFAYDYYVVSGSTGSVK